VIGFEGFMKNRPYYGGAKAEAVYRQSKENWVFVDFTQEEGMKFAMAVLRAGLGMKNKGNNFHLRVLWDGKPSENVAVQVYGEEEIKTK